MQLINLRDYRCPACNLEFSDLWKNSSKNNITKSFVRCKNGHEFDITDSIPDFTWPKELIEIDESTRTLYNQLAEEYDKFADIPFKSYKVSEKEVREKMVDQLSIGPEDTVLEIGCGDGRGSEYIARRLNKKGNLYLQELSPAFLQKAIRRLSKYKELQIEYSVANGCYLPFPDNFFDAAHHFGGINTFSDIPRSLQELTRVVKPGGKVVVGDESLGPWLRATNFGKIMMNSNPLLKYEIPFKFIPVEAREVKVEWIMMGAFFVLEFTVGEGEPEADYHVPIPSQRGGTHWSRYYGNLEGITDDAKKMAYEAQKRSGKSMHDWLDEVVRKAAVIQLKNLND